MIIIAIALAVCTVGLGLVLGRIVYLREVRQLPKISEWQARKNAAPLTSAVAQRQVVDE